MYVYIYIYTYTINVDLISLPYIFTKVVEDYFVKYT